MARVVNVGADATQRGEFKLIPVGTKVKVSVYEVDETVTGPNSKFPGEPQFVYTAKVTEEGEFKGRELRYNYIPLHGKGNDGWKLATFADAVGWEVSDDGAIEVPDNLNEVLGTEFVARIGQQKSQKTNPETGEPYVNNTITATAPLKGYKPKGASEPEAKKDPWA